MPTRRKSSTPKKPTSGRGSKKVTVKEEPKEEEVDEDEEETKKPRSSRGTKRKSAVKKQEVSEDEAEDEDSETEKEETDDEERGRGKRKRRESKSYEPDDFTLKQFDNALKAAVIAEGRGEKLGDIAGVRNCMKKFTLTSDEFSQAYKFLFSNRGIANKKLMKEKLLGFSGYLPPLPKGRYNKEKQDEDDEVIETKFAIKAFKMNLSQIKMLCDYFNVDNQEENGKFCNKEDMIDRLLDFLGAPDESLIRGKETKKPEAKKKTPTKAKTPEPKRKTIVKTVLVDPFDVIKDYVKGVPPSDDALRQWVKAYIVCVDMETATTKDAVRTASAKFGVDMTEKKARIKQLLAEEL